MKPFGKYLVESGQIDSNQLLLGLMEQIKSTPSTAEAVMELNLLSTDQQIAILEEQVVSQTDYVTSASKLGFWSEEMKNRVEDLIFERKTSLMDIIIANEWATTKDLTSKLDEYLVEFEGDIKSTRSDKIEEKSTKHEDSENQSDFVSQASEPWDHITDVFSDDRRQRLVLIAELCAEMNGDSLKGTLDNLYEDFEPLLKIEPVAGLSKFFSFVEALGVAFAKYSSAEIGLMESQASSFSLLFIEATNFIWKILNNASKSGSEEGYLSNESVRATLEDFENRFDALRSDLGKAA